MDELKMKELMAFDEIYRAVISGYIKKNDKNKKLIIEINKIIASRSMIFNIETMASDKAYRIIKDIHDEVKHLHEH